MISVIKLSDLIAFSVPPVESSSGLVAVADAGGGGGGGIASVCIWPATAGIDDAMSSAAAAQSTRSFFIRFLLKGGCKEQTYPKSRGIRIPKTAIVVPH